MPDKSRRDSNDKKSTTSTPSSSLTLAQKIALAKGLAAMNCDFRFGEQIASTSGATRFTIHERVSTHAFGYTYSVVRNHDNAQCMMKIEPMTTDPNMVEFETLARESHVLKAMQNYRENLTEYFPNLLVTTHKQGFYHAIFTTPYGINMFEMKKRMKVRHFRPFTAIRISLDMFKAIHSLHTIGFVHRCLKPKSFCVGLGDFSRNILLTDFGLTSAFRDSANKHVAKTNEAEFLGLLRYAPRASHRMENHGRVDDLESWLYISLELFDYEIIAWRNEKEDHNVHEWKARFFKQPGRFPFEKSSMGFWEIFKLICPLSFTDEPNYARILQLLLAICHDLNVNLNEPFEWDALAEDSTNDGNTSD